MAPLTITINGSSKITRPADRGILNISVRAEGSDKELVALQVSSTSNEVHKLFTELSPKTEFGNIKADAPVTQFSSTMIRTWYETHDKTSLARSRVYHASTAVTATFQNFSTMNEIAAKLLQYHDVHIDSIDWALTDATIQALGQESRKLAMRDAIQKAEDYCEIVGRKVVVTEISNSDYGGDFQVKCMMAGGPASSGLLNYAGDGTHQQDSLDMTPQEIKAEGSVRVKFESEPGE